MTNSLICLHFRQYHGFVKYILPKNIAKTGAGVAGGSAGMLYGAAYGSVLPGVGTAVGGFVGGIVGGIVGGMALGGATSLVLDATVENDTAKMSRQIQYAFAELADEYVLSEQEAFDVVDEFKKLNIPKIFEDLHAAKRRDIYAKDLLRPLIHERIERRQSVRLPSDQEVAQAAVSLAREIIDDQEPAPEGALQATELIVSKVADTPAIESPGRVIEPKTVPAPAAPVARKIRQLDDILNEFDILLNDESHFFVGYGLGTKSAQKRLRNAVQTFAYAHAQYKEECAESPSAFVDFTALGSGKDGMYVGERTIYIRPSWEDRKVFLLKEIRSISVVEYCQELEINGKRFKYLHESMTPSMVLLVKCINRYLDQFKADA